jgi:hypothetical protein
VKTALSQLGLGVSKLTLGKSSSIDNLRVSGVKTLSGERVIYHRSRNTVKRFPMADLVILRFSSFVTARSLLNHTTARLLHSLTTELSRPVAVL